MPVTDNNRLMYSQIPSRTIRENIIARLKRFDYSYDVDGYNLKVFLPMWCYLNLKFTGDKIKISSRITFGFRFLPLEINFFIYSIGLYLLTWFKWEALNKAIFVALAVVLLHFVICFIKLESLRSIIHNWIEKDLQSED